MMSVLRRPDFRLLFAGVFATMFGESSLLLVLAIWVKELTASTSLAGATLFAVVAPQTLSIMLGAVLVTLVDYRLLFLVIALVNLVCAVYLWVGRRLTPGSVSGATEGSALPPVPLQPLGAGEALQGGQPLLDRNDGGVGQR